MAACFGRIYHSGRMFAQLSPSGHQFSEGSLSGKLRLLSVVDPTPPSCLLSRVWKDRAPGARYDRA